MSVLCQPAVRRRQSGARRAQGVQLVSRIEFRQHLIGLDAIAHARLPFDDPSPDPKRERDLLFSQNLPCKQDRLAKLAFSCDHGAHRTRRRRPSGGLLLAPAHEDGHAQADKNHRRPSESRLVFEVHHGQGIPSSSPLIAVAKHRSSMS